MIWRRRTIAELEFPLEMGVYGGRDGFRAQGLTATTHFAGWNLGVFLFNERWQDSDLPSQYLFASAHNWALRDKTDPDSWWCEAFVYAVDGHLTPAQGRKSVEKKNAPALGELDFAVNEVSALAYQELIDQNREEQRARRPWVYDRNYDRNYDGDYAGALWAKDLTGEFGTFPLEVFDRPFPPYLPRLVASKTPEGWVRMGQYLTLPFSPEHPLPTLDGEAVTLDVFRVESDDDGKLVAEEVMRGGGKPDFTLLVGSRSAIGLEGEQ